MVRDGQERGRHAIEERELVFLHEAQGVSYRESFHQHMGGAGENQRAHDQRPVDVIKGEKQETRIPVRDLMIRHALVVVRYQISVGQHHSLGKTRGAARIGQGD